MPKPPEDGRSGGRGRAARKGTVVAGGGGRRRAARKDTVVAGGGEGQNAVKLEPVDNAESDAGFGDARGRAIAAIPVQSKNPSSQPHLATAGPSRRRRQPKVIIVITSSSDEDDDEGNRGFRAESPPRKARLVQGDSHGKSIIKEEPHSDSGSPARPPAGTRSKARDAAPGSPKANRKRKRQSAATARRGEHGGRQEPKGAAIAGGGEVQKRMKPKPVDDVATSNAEFRSVQGDGHGMSIIKEEPPSDSGSPARPPAGTRSKARDVAPGSPKANRKRKRQSAATARRGEHGGATIASGGEVQNLMKPQPVKDGASNAEFRGARGRALAGIPPQSGKPRSPLRVAVAGPSRRRQPKVVIEISSSSDVDHDDEEEHRGFARQSSVKEEPASDPGSPARLPAGTRSKVEEGRSTAGKRKRERRSPLRGRRDSVHAAREVTSDSDDSVSSDQEVSDDTDYSVEQEKKNKKKKEEEKEKREKNMKEEGKRKQKNEEDEKEEKRNKKNKEDEKEDEEKRRKNKDEEERKTREDEEQQEEERRKKKKKKNKKEDEKEEKKEEEEEKRKKEEEEEEGKRKKKNKEDEEEKMRKKNKEEEEKRKKRRDEEQQENERRKNKKEDEKEKRRNRKNKKEKTKMKEEEERRKKKNKKKKNKEDVEERPLQRAVHPAQLMSYDDTDDKERVQPLSQHSTPVVDYSNGNAKEDEEQEQQEGEEKGEEVAKDSNGGGSKDENGVAHESEQEGDYEEDSHSMYSYEGDDEDAEDDSEEEDQKEFEGAEEVQPCGPRNTKSEGDATFRKKMFEGIYYLEEPINTSGEGIHSRTRSQRTCSDSKLLKRGTFSKPLSIDIDSTSESEEEKPEPVPAYQEVLSPSEDDLHVARRKKRRQNSRGENIEGSKSTGSDEAEVHVRRYQRLKKGPSNGQAAKKEGGKAYVGSNPNRLKHAPHGEGPMNNAQDDLSFKRYANLAKMGKHQSPRAKAAYDELFNSMFAEWQNFSKPVIPADQEGGNTLPLLFSFDDQDEQNKSEGDEPQGEFWMEYDMALESINIGCQGCKEVPKVTSCENGDHEFIIDEEIGVRCKHCDFVDLEIRYVVPTLGKFAAERGSRASPEPDLLEEMLSVFEKNDLLASDEHEAAFGAGKACSVWDLIPGVKEDMFPHQQDAFEFMWRKLAGSTKMEKIEELRGTANPDIGGGCVISHAPGTGKTRLAISFVQSYIRAFPRCCPVIIAPRAMLATWEKEFKKWNVKLPFHVLNSTEIIWSDDRTIQEKAENDGSFARRLCANKMDQNYRRLVKLASWVNGTSIIGVSYSLFRKLANDEGMDGDNVRKLLLERPDLLVLDEGHTPRNKKSLIWKVLAQVRTEKRIILSGTLFQNNFEELYNTLCLVRPKDAMLLEKNEGKDWTSLRLNNVTQENIDKVRAKLEPVVHYHKGNFLERSLPGLKETVVILNPLPRQKEIIANMEKTAVNGALDAEYKMSLALVHPSLVTCAKLSEKEACMVDNTLLESLRWDPCEGVKTRFVVEVVKQCQVLNERVLVFSQYLEPLCLIMDQLKKRFRWTEDKEILQMSGNVRVKQREAMMAAFNDMKSESKVMLASTKACCEGITLVGASRVVLLDVVWNPSVLRQAIGRAYRFGQKKVVYTYNLIADGSKEMEKYSRQAKKEHMSKMLFSIEEQPEGGKISPESTFDDRILEVMTAREDLKDLFVQIRIENQVDGPIRDVGGETGQKTPNPTI